MAKELFAKAKNKIIPFDQDGDFFYRRAKKLEENNDYIEALRYYRKALEKEPENIEYMLDLADAFTEMNCFQESNKILLSMLHNDQVVPDCYFGMGCNFLGLQDLNNARECFNKYLQVDEDGMYSEDANELLGFIDQEKFFFDAINGIGTEDEELYELANEGKVFIDRGEYKEAIEKLQKVVDGDPELIYARNNLALAYFCANQTDKAIEITKETLREFPSNIHAICNMAIFYTDMGQDARAERYIKALTNIYYTDGEDVHKIAATLCELKRHREAYRYLKILLQYKPYEIRVLHYAAVAAFNLKEFNRALLYWRQIEKIFPHNTISSFYINRTLQIIDGDREFEELSYTYQVTYNEMLKRIKEINNFVHKSLESQVELWEADDSIYKLLWWGIEISDKVIKNSILNTVANIGDEAAEEFLKDFLLRKEEREDIKRDALGLLKKINAKEPYMAYMEDSLVEVRVSVVDVDRESIPEKYRDVFDFTISSMRDRYEEGYEEFIQTIWFGFINLLHPADLPRIQKMETWAATLEYYYCTAHDIDVEKTELAQRYSISISSINYNLKKLNSTMSRTTDIK